MVDIHCHILPGVDDGSGNFNDSIEMVKMAAASGTRNIVATPHCNIPDFYENQWGSNLQELFNRLQKEISVRNIRLLQIIRTAQKAPI